MNSAKLLLALALPAMSMAYETKFFHIQSDGSVMGANTSKTTVSVSHGSTGVYIVSTPNVMYAGQTVGPIPLVTAVGSDNRFCKVASFTTSQTTVLCFGGIGLPADSSFFLWFIPQGNDREISFAYAPNPTAAFYALPHHYTTNGAVPTVTRTATGRYTVAFPGLNGGIQSQVQVTAVGTVPVSCAPTGWDNQNSAFTVYVKCGAATVLGDSEFTVAVIPAGANPRALGFAVYSATAPGNTQFNYNPEGSVTVTGTPSSGHVVTFQGLNINRYPGMNAVVNVITSSGGSAPGYCKVDDYFEGTGTDLSLRVRCYESNGNLASASFAIAIMPREYLLNAGFEAPPVLGSPVSAPLLGWTLVSGQATIQRLSGQAADDGNQWTRLSANGNNSIFYQDVDTVPGTGYDVRFGFSNRAGAPNSSIRVRWGGQIIATIVRTGSPWQTYTYTVYGGNGSTTRLQFEGLGGGTECDFLDDVRVVYNPSAPPPPAYTIQTSPSGHPITVDGTSYTAPQTFYWGANTQHSISVETVREATPGTRLQFTNWTGPSFQTASATTTITVPASAATYTANYTIQHLLSLTVAPAGGGSVSVSPLGSSGYHNAGTTVTLIASPNASFGFAGYSGSITSSSQTVQVVMNVPKGVNATFSGCAYTLAASSATFAASGGDGSVGVTTLPGCPWLVANLPAWIQVVQITGDLFRYTVAQNTGAARSAQITVAGKPYTVSQDAGTAGCSYSINPTSAGLLVPASGAGGFVVTVTTTAGCGWTVTGMPNWITTSTPLPATGPGTVLIHVLANSGAARSATLTIAGKSYSVLQDAGAAGCTYLLSSTGTGVLPAGGAGSLSMQVTTQAGCSWTATGLPSWITTSTALPITGGGTFYFDVLLNTGAARSAQLTIAGQPYTVSQAAAQGCVYSLNPAGAIQIPASGATGSVQVTTTSACSWTATLPSWITTTTTLPDFGPGPFAYTVQPNGGAARTAEVVIAGQIVTFLQAGVIPPPTQTAGLRFKPLAPCRLVETRPEYNDPSRTGVFGPPFLNAGQTRELPLAQSPTCVVPANAKAYVLNVTVIPRPGGVVDFVTVWPSGEARPNVWTVRTPDGQTVANTQIVKAGANGGVSLYTSHASDFVIDISGYFTDDPVVSNLVFYPMTPCRVIDTRSDYRPVPGPFGPPSMQTRVGRSFRFPLSPTCVIPAGAAAYSVTLTVAPPGPLPFLTTWPTGGGLPNVSSINSFVGRTLANNVIVPASNDGSIDVYAFEATDFIMDINGYFAPDNGTTGQFYFPVTQCRVYNTLGANAPKFEDTTTRTVNMVTGPCAGIPADARGYAVNVTAVPNGNPMPFITAYPTGQGQPNASVLNAFEGQTVTNFTIVPAGTLGQLNVYAYRRTDVVVEVNGYFGR